MTRGAAPDAVGTGRVPWCPQASLERLHLVAALRADIRSWMTARDVLEVVTPVLSLAAPSDVHLDAFRTCGASAIANEASGAAPGCGGIRHGAAGSEEPRYLQTSPEYPMKRLLAAYATDIYQIAPVFRSGERGARHNPEFTMLEWYRTGMDHVALMDDVEALLRELWVHGDRPWKPPERHALHDVVEAVLGNGAVGSDEDEPFVDVATVRAHFVARGRSFPDSIGDDADAALDLLLDEFVLPTLSDDRATFLHGWPPSQAALSRIGRDARGRAIAERFELYVGALELGNGYHELADATEQRKRFERDLARRRSLGRETPPLDERLLDALATGFPDCAGVAIGLERLSMAIGDCECIDEMLAFGFERA